MTHSRPIVMSGPMVQAILAGKKTCTRRVLTPQPPSETITRSTPYSLCPAVARRISVYSLNDYDALPKEPGVFSVYGSVSVVRDACGQTTWTSPFGVPGDHLWVKEAFLPDPSADHEAWDQTRAGYLGWDDHRRTSELPAALRTRDHVLYAASWTGSALQWKSPRFMPRWASRLTLEVTGVSVERLHDITDVDAINEGVTTLPDAWLAKHWPDYVQERDRVDAHNAQLTTQGQFLGLTRPPLGPSPREQFRAYWGDIHGADAWASNPWVWRVEFKQVPA